MIRRPRRDLLTWLNGALAGRYRIERELGRGGMAVVYRAHDARHDRYVALKALRPELTATVGAERFLREIQIAAKLTHPNILTVYDSGDADGLLYYVMPLVDGKSVRDRLAAEAQLPVDEALRIAREVAGALAFAHARGIVHRDIKPENILLEGDHAMVADFGIATAVSRVERDTLTDTGVVIGTPTYMSPEQIEGEGDVDPRVDVYALGCVLYEMLAGQAPFTGTSAMAILAQKSTGAVPSLRVLREAVPAALERVVAKAIASRPVDRFDSVEALGEALRGDRLVSAAPAMSVAVLPFTNMSADTETDYLSDGIAEEITNALAKIRALRVAARTSAFSFRGKGLDIRQIGERLGVATVLEGSVRKAGEQLRITAQLVSVDDGYHLWSERYDRKMADIFAIEDEIAQNIVRALQVVLSETEQRAIGKAPTEDVRAYEYYLRGLQFMAQWRKKNVQYARQMFERAIQVDPTFALAHAGVANCCAMLHLYYPGSDAELEVADTASRRALELDPSRSEAHAARGFALFQLKRLDDARAEFRIAMEMDPKQFDARYLHARLCFEQGELAEAAGLFAEAALVREDYQASFFAAQSWAAIGEHDKAQVAYREALRVVEHHMDLNPDDARAATMCAVSHCRLGDAEAGLEWAERAIAIDPEDAGVRYNVACLYALEDRTDRAIQCLEEAFAKGFGNRSWIANDPDLASLREHPRFLALMAEMAERERRGP